MFLRLGAVDMSRLNSWRGIALVSFFLGMSLVLPASVQKWYKYGPVTRSQASAIFDRLLSRSKNLALISAHGGRSGGSET